MNMTEQVDDARIDTLDGARKYITAKWARIASRVENALMRATSMPNCICAMISSYLIIDSRIFDMLLAPRNGCDPAKKLRGTQLGSHILRLWTHYDNDNTVCRIILSDGHFNHPYEIYANDAPDGYALLELFAKPKSYRIRRRDNIYPQLLDLLLREFDKWIKSHKQAI